MSEILYIQTEKNVEVHSPQVCLGDVAKLACGDQKILDRNLVRRVMNIPDQAQGRYVVSAVDIVRAVAREEKNLDVTHIGEANVIVTYKKPAKAGRWKEYIKTVFVCILSFFGAAFSIMTFNNDVDIQTLFPRLYFQLTGIVPEGWTLLEFCYSLGIGIGVIFFFNHFGHGKITRDPSPIEVQMRTYEEDVDKTLIADKNRKEKHT
ncbi:MAG TPA: stage V sporulation protein AA [Candidatus Blautia avicola]|uniref:Stage V sporulation protein AA n=1 Tax=Candidatus Blautia avicola TaxID=2838483 RepID=A0A9D2QTY8_9FIRM|nr:stage V sporulation protein AA [Candidatus Blautia avicola]